MAMRVAAAMIATIPRMLSRDMANGNLPRRCDGCAGSVITASVPGIGIVGVAGHRRLSLLRMLVGFNQAWIGSLTTAQLTHSRANQPDRNGQSDRVFTDFLFEPAGRQRLKSVTNATTDTGRFSTPASTLVSADLPQARGRTGCRRTRPRQRCGAHRAAATPSTRRRST